MKTNNVSGVGGALPPVLRDVLSIPKKVETDLKSLYQQFQSEVVKPVKSTSVSHARSLYRDGKWIDASKVFEAIGDRYRAMYCLHRALEAKEGVKSENYKKIAELYSSVGRTKRAKRYVNSSNYQLIRENKRCAKEFPTEKGINAATFVKNLNDPELKEHLQTVASAKPAHVEQRSVVVAKKKDGQAQPPIKVVAKPPEVNSVPRAVETNEFAKVVKQEKQEPEPVRQEPKEKPKGQLRQEEPKRQTKTQEKKGSEKVARRPGESTTLKALGGGVKSIVNRAGQNSPKLRPANAAVARTGDEDQNGNSVSGLGFGSGSSGGGGAHGKIQSLGVYESSVSSLPQRSEREQKFVRKLDAYKDEGIDDLDREGFASKYPSEIEGGGEAQFESAGDIEQRIKELERGIRNAISYLSNNQNKDKGKLARTSREAERLLEEWQYNKKCIAQYDEKAIRRYSENMQKLEKIIERRGI